MKKTNSRTPASCLVDDQGRKVLEDTVQPFLVGQMAHVKTARWLDETARWLDELVWLG